MWAVTFLSKAEARANPSLSPIFCKVLLEQAMPICLHIVYGCFHHTMSDLTSSDRDHVPCKAENIRSLALSRESLPASAWEQNADRPHLHWNVCKHNLHSTQLAGQSYFQNNMKTLFIFFIWLSPSAQWSFPEATWCVMSQQTTCRSRHEIQLFSLKPDIKEIWKKTCHSSD